MKSPIISVVMPVYNGELYLREAIESILNQTFTDFEFIIINDGSTDNSKNIIESYDDQRIIYIEQENKGLAKTLNIGASFCRGEFLARMDQDDICQLDRFFIQYTFLIKHSNISVLSSAVIFINEKGYNLGRSFPVTWPFIIKNKLLNKGCVINHPAVMMRRNDFEAVGKYSEIVGGRFTDYHLWVKLINKGFKIKNISKVLLQYRITKSSMSSEYSLTPTSQKILLKVIKVERLDMREIDKLNNAIKNDKGRVNKRIQVFNNNQYFIYSKLSFIGDGIKNNLISGVNNILSLISFNF